MFKIAIIGEFDPNFRPHVATNEAIEHNRSGIKTPFQYEWISTDDVTTRFQELITYYQGFWIAPGSPYKNMLAAIQLIEYTRLHDLPTLGTCGGFQHMAIEFARNVLDIQDAEHAEYDPYASKLVVNSLSCDLKGEPLMVELTDDASKTYAVYKTQHIKEKYYCNFGLNPSYQSLFEGQGFCIVGTDKHQEARILELKQHSFFIATLFVPQDNSSNDEPHPLVKAFLLASEEKALLHKH